MSDFIEDLLLTYDAAGPGACSSSFLKGLLKELRRSKVTHRLRDEYAMPQYA